MIAAASLSSLDSFIDEAFDDASVRHGALGLTRAQFRALLLAKTRRQDPTTSEADTIRVLAGYHLQDVYLTSACSLGDERAWCRFGAIYGKYIRQLVYRRTRPNEPARELADRIMVDLFMPDRSGHSRISSYDGRSSLAQWLRVIVTHRITNERARKANHLACSDDLPVCDDAALSTVEAAGRSRYCAKAVNDALRVACHELTPRERLILLWRYQDNLRLTEIASLLSVHVSTVNRQLERLCLKLRSQVTHLLVTRYKLTEPTVQECLADVVDNSAETISLLSVLRQLTQSHAHD